METKSIWIFKSHFKQNDLQNYALKQVSQTLVTIIVKFVCHFNSNNNSYVK